MQPNPLQYIYAYLLGRNIIHSSVLRIHNNNVVNQFLKLQNSSE